MSHLLVQSCQTRSLNLPRKHIKTNSVCNTRNVDLSQRGCKKVHRPDQQPDPTCVCIIDFHSRPIALLWYNYRDIIVESAFFCALPLPFEKPSAEAKVNERLLSIRSIDVKSQTRNRPRSGSASRAVKGFTPEADPHLGQIFPPETRNLLTPLLGHLSVTVLEADPLLGRWNDRDQVRCQPNFYNLWYRNYWRA
jgi:hypothetical protein